ncbi:MAG: HesB/IscA family protein [Candidatus Kariarchaeaceae archaeon]|jgi:iron-sulfur cluster assembly accessory protein
MEMETETKLVTITEAALEQVKDVIKQQDKPDLFLRVFVQGGCAGINFGMALDMKQMNDDTEFFVDGIKVVVDRVSFPYVQGATVDFDTTGEKSGFRISNPENEALLSQAGGCSSGSCGSGGCC